MDLVHILFVGLRSQWPILLVSLFGIMHLHGTINVPTGSSTVNVSTYLK